MKRRESERKNNRSTDLLPPEISLIALAQKGVRRDGVFLSVCNGFNQSRSRNVQGGGKVFFYF
jgi:hypothetical protein